MSPYVQCLLILLIPSVIAFRTGKGESGADFFDYLNNISVLVNRAFGKPIEQKQESQSNHLFGAFLRMLGLDNKKIGAIAVNAIITIAQLISSSLSLKQPANTPPTQRSAPNQEDAYETMMKNPDVAETFEYAIDRDLVENVIEYVKERSLDEETGCLQLLICKSRPFFRRMQQIIAARRGNSTESFQDPMYGYFPNVEEVADYADTCEKRHPYCNIWV
nr:unnamed protein product [Callosobruchus chinensis]